MKYYKVVDHYDYDIEKYYSAIMDKNDNKTLCVEYKVNKFVSAPKTAFKKGFGLTCFDDLGYAIKFKDDCSLEIWECEIENKINVPKWFGTMTGVSAGRLLLKSYESSSCWPPGTIMAEKIKLVRRVK